MNYVTSKDGAKIAYSKIGKGPAIILVDGALVYRDSHSPMPKLAQALQDSCTVITYDRRGRGESGDTQPYTIDKEIEDIDALINMAGGSAALYGISSGALLAAMAASKLAKKVSKLALYEAPLVLDDSRPPIPNDYVAVLENFIRMHQPAKAMQYFMKVAVGMPTFVIKLAPIFPGWSKSKAVAGTLVYDGKIVGASTKNGTLVADLWKQASMPVMIMAGGKSPAWIRNGNQQLADSFKNADFSIIPGQSHMIAASAQAPVIKKFIKTT